jgi:virulence-associated protein VapD
MKHLKEHLLLLLFLPSLILSQSLRERFDEFDNCCRNVRGYVGALKAEVEREKAVIPDVAKTYAQKIGECLNDVKQTYAGLKKSLNKNQLELVRGNIAYLDEYCKRSELHYQNLVDELKKSNPKPERVRELLIAIYNESRKVSQEVRLMREKLGIK